MKDVSVVEDNDGAEIIEDVDATGSKIQEIRHKTELLDEIFDDGGISGFISQFVEVLDNLHERVLELENSERQRNET